MSSLPVADLARAYEAVRAQVTGVVSPIAPRGLALILDAGLTGTRQDIVSIRTANTSFPSPA